MKRCISLLFSSRYLNKSFDMIFPPTLSFLNCTLLSLACLVFSTLLASILFLQRFLEPSKSDGQSLFAAYLIPLAFSKGVRAICGPSKGIMLGNTCKCIFYLVVQNTIARHSRQISVCSGLPKLSVGERWVLYLVLYLVLKSSNHVAACRADPSSWVAFGVCGIVFTLNRGCASMVLSNSNRLTSNLAVVCSDFTPIRRS